MTFGNFTKATDNYHFLTHYVRCHFGYLQAFLLLSAVHERRELLRPAVPSPEDPDHQERCHSLTPYEILVEIYYCYTETRT